MQDLEPELPEPSEPESAETWPNAVSLTQIRRVLTSLISQGKLRTFGGGKRSFSAPVYVTREDQVRLGYELAPGAGEATAEELISTLVEVRLAVLLKEVADLKARVAALERLYTYKLVTAHCLPQHAS